MLTALDEAKKKEIVDLISARLAKGGRGASCPMCGHDGFALADGYFSNALQADFQNITLGGPSVPTAAIICTNCGFVSQHAIGVIGLRVEE